MKHSLAVIQDLEDAINPHICPVHPDVPRFPGATKGHRKRSCRAHTIDVCRITKRELEYIGELMNITRERTRQLEESIGAKLNRNPLAKRLRLDIF